MGVLVGVGGTAVGLDVLVAVGVTVGVTVTVGVCVGSKSTTPSDGSFRSAQMPNRMLTTSSVHTVRKMRRNTGTPFVGARLLAQQYNAKENRTGTRKKRNQRHSTPSSFPLFPYTDTPLLLLSVLLCSLCALCVAVWSLFLESQLGDGQRPLLPRHAVRNARLPLKRVHILQIPLVIANHRLLVGVARHIAQHTLGFLD